MGLYFKTYLERLTACTEAVEATDADGRPLPAENAFDLLCDTTARVARLGLKQFLCGNGASAAFSNHMALDWTKNGGVPSHSFSDSALLTALGNDLGYEDSFSAPLEWYASEGDLLTAISSSGNSANISKAIEAARRKKLTVVTLTGLKPDNRCRKLGDVNLYVPAKTYGIVECAHQILLHIWLDKHMGISEWTRNEFQNMNCNEYTP